MTFFRYINLLSAAALLFCASCRRDDSWHSAEGMVWNTAYHIQWRGPEELADSIMAVLDSVGSTMSVFDPNSLVSRVNDTCALRVSLMFTEIYATSRRIHKETEGAFDPTLAPLITAWGFGKGHTCTADTARIDSLLAITGLHRTHLAGDTLIKERRDITFNFSAIAKGYGCDAVGAILRRNGVTDMLVEIGGEISCTGENPRGAAWRVSVDRPVLQKGAPLHESQILIEVTDAGIATSGDYRNFHESGGTRFGHTIDPATGRPVKTDVLSATAIAPTAMEADAYATSCMVLGSEKSRRLATRLHLPVLLVLADSTVWMSEWFMKYIPSR